MMNSSINQRRRTKRRQSDSRKIAVNEARQTSLLETLVNFQYQTLDRPSVPDVLPLSIKPHKTYTFSRQSAPTDIFAGVSENDYAYYFALSQLNDYTDFVSLFDQYRILQVKFVVRTFPGIITNPNNYISALDYDDATALPYTQLAQYQTALISSSGVNQTRFLNPCLSVGVYNGVATLGYSSQYGLWCDMANNSVQHYGVKMAVPPLLSGATSVPFATITAEVIFQCKNPR